MERGQSDDGKPETLFPAASSQPVHHCRCSQLALYLCLTAFLTASSQPVPRPSPGSEENVTERTFTNQPVLVMIDLRESGHPLFNGTSSFFRGALKSKGGKEHRQYELLSHHYIGHSRRDSKMMTESKCEREQFKRRIIFMSMYNDIVWGKRGNKEKCIANALRVTE